MESLGRFRIHYDTTIDEVVDMIAGLLGKYSEFTIQLCENDNEALSYIDYELVRKKDE